MSNVVGLAHESDVDPALFCPDAAKTSECAAAACATAECAAAECAAAACASAECAEAECAAAACASAECAAAECAAAECATRAEMSAEGVEHSELLSDTGAAVGHGTPPPSVYESDIACESSRELPESGLALVAYKGNAVAALEIALEESS